MREPFSVSGLNAYVRDRLASDPVLMGLSVRGEISDFHLQRPSGHLYFRLKDERSSLRCVMFSASKKLLSEDFKDGDEVIVYGSLGVYAARGEYQVYVSFIEAIGAGARLLALEKLKKKLAAEGLFAPERKKMISRFPKTIAIISAPGSAALADIKTNLRRRYPLAELRLHPSLVQGEDAPKELRRALEAAISERPTTIIIGRGGGASEDLSAFNDEALVRLAAASPIPLIAAIGHEVDFTLLDHVADRRVSTPTAAAEAAAVDIKDIKTELLWAGERLDSALKEKIKALKEKLMLLGGRAFFRDPSLIGRSLKDKLEHLQKRLGLAYKERISACRALLLAFRQRLEAIGPMNVIARGYAFLTKKTGEVIVTAKEAAVGEEVKATLKDGILTAKITKKETRHG